MSCNVASTPQNWDSVIAFDQNGTKVEHQRQQMHLAATLSTPLSDAAHTQTTATPAPSKSPAWRCHACCRILAGP
jgi:hypothetical protein